MSLVNELKRRNVIRVGIAYVLIAWVLLQGADFALDLIDAPNWVIQALFLLALIGLPAVLIFAWVFEMTPEGLRRESQVDRTRSITQQTGRKLDRVIIAFLVLVIVLMAVERLWQPPESGESVAQAPGEPAAAAVEADGAHPAEARPSIAVLPFVNRSKAEDDAFFVDGVHDDLLTQLARISALKVISRTSVSAYRDTAKPIPLIGRELGVATVMEGSVQRAGERIRINVQLIDATTDEHLWAEIYDRQLTAANIFEIQSEIASAIAAALRAALTPLETEQLAKRPTENLAAYEAYLLGRQRLARRTVADLAEAANYFQQAVDLDPQFALAYVGLADAWQLQADYGSLAIDTAVGLARPPVERALQLDDRLGEAYATLASILEYEGDDDGAERYYLRAIELAPNYADVLNWYGLSLMHSRGLPEKAVIWFERGLEVDPLSLVMRGNYAYALEQLGRFEDSSAELSKLLVMDAGFLNTYRFIAAVAWQVNGRLDNAVDWMLKVRRLDAREPATNADLAMLFSELGDAAVALCFGERAHSFGGASSWVNGILAWLDLVSGDAEQTQAHAMVSLENNWVRREKGLPLALVGTIWRQAGRIDDLFDLYQAHFPELIPMSDQNLNRANFSIAVDLAHVLISTNREPEAEPLLEAAWTYIQDVPRLGFAGYGIEDARILALQGEPDAALTALEEAVQAGWRLYWRFYLEFDPVFESLRDDARFRSIVDTVRVDMAEQLERVRAARYDLGDCGG
jgi:TolB-like protein/Flp pilus assembly protein TadD